MSDTNAQGAQSQGQTPPAEPADDGKGGKQAILADLATERDKRQALEQQVQQMQDQQRQQSEAFAKALGVNTDETSDITRLADQVAALSQSFATTQHQNLVLSVATANGITEKADIDLLGSVKDEQAMRDLAARLAKPSTPGNAPAPQPRPDLTQGGHQGSGQGGTPEQDFAMFLNNAMGR